MGFFGNLIEKIKGKQNREQTLLLEEGVQEKEKSIKVIYFSKVENDSLEHEIEIINNGKNIRLGNFLSIKEVKPNNISIKQIVRKLQSELDSFEDVTSMYRLNKQRESTKDKVNRMTEDIPGFMVYDEFESFIDSFKPEQVIDYQELENLPKKVDTSKLTQTQKQDISRRLQTRMSELQKIKTADQAWEDRENIISFIQEIEHLPDNPIIGAISKGKAEGIEPDEETIILIAKSMENIPNEDGALYSVYLKIEEKRILKKMRYTLVENSDKLDRKTFDTIYKYMESLNKYDLHDIKGGFSSEILSYVIDEINNMNTEKYINEVKDVDLSLARTICSKCPDMEDKEKMLRFLYSRNASLGQLSNRKGNPLREFIETTDFKDEDNRESKEFLLLASEVEKDYLRSQFKEFFEITNEKDENSMSKFKERIASSAKITQEPIVAPNQPIQKAQKTEEIEK